MLLKLSEGLFSTCFNQCGERKPTKIVSFSHPRDPITETENVMEPRYYAFRRWLDILIILWQYDWMPRATPSRNLFTKAWGGIVQVFLVTNHFQVPKMEEYSPWYKQYVMAYVRENLTFPPKIAKNKVQYWQYLHFWYLNPLVILGFGDINGFELFTVCRKLGSPYNRPPKHPPALEASTPVTTVGSGGFGGNYLWCYCWWK